MNFDTTNATDLISWIIGGIVALTGIIQISPIKLNPWGWILKKIGKTVNEEVITKVDKLEKDINQMKLTMDERNAVNARTKILRFGDELLHGEKHTKDAFDDILIAIDEYDRYCSSHEGFRNKITEHTEKRINDTYQKCLEENSFL